MKTGMTVLVLAIVVTAVLPAAPEITLSAAASLTTVLQDLEVPAEASCGAKVLLNLGASGTLRRQIEEGAPVDVFFSAARLDMDQLQKKGLVIPETRVDLLGNSLVLVGGPEARPVTGKGDLRAVLQSASVLAIGDPEAVPAGRYAREALSAWGLWDLVASKTAHAGSVREALQFVQSGSAPVGIVFKTDATSAAPAGSVKVLFSFPNEILSTPIVYPVAVVSATSDRAAAEKLVQFLRGDTARQAFRAAGFTVP
ncbi:MAG TPA: molybdate ABC transporter substrate-binding protein [Spirochaetia bacterium]|nr:molybdate ABC transporter substrate-binding protein [Spirochaetia bacterium]